MRRLEMQTIYKGISEHEKSTVELRLMKIGEEFGEVVQAYIGTQGANKRKGYTHSNLDVATELADVVITAMTAMHDFVEYPEDFIQMEFERVAWRVRAEGS